MSEQLAAVATVVTCAGSFFAFGFVAGYFANQNRMRRHFRELASQEIKRVNAAWERWMGIIQRSEGKRNDGDSPAGIPHERHGA